MLNAQIDENEKTSSTKGMTLDEMIAQVWNCFFIGNIQNYMYFKLFVFFVAGYETTANTVTSILYFLAKNPEYIEKLRREADEFEAKVSYFGFSSSSFCFNFLGHEQSNIRINTFHMCNFKRSSSTASPCWN